MKNNWLKNLISIPLAMVMLFEFSTFQNSFSQTKLPENHSLSQRLKVREEFQRQAKTLVMEELKGLGFIKKQEPIVRVLVTFDDAKLLADYSTFIQPFTVDDPAQSPADIEKQLKPILDSLKKNLEQTKENTVSSQSTEKVAVAGIRFGMLNVDLQDGVQATSPNSTVTVNSKPMLGLSIVLSDPNSRKKQIPVFPFDPSDYVKNVAVTVLVPKETPPLRIENIRKSLVEGLELKRFSSSAAQALIEFGNLEKPTDQADSNESEISKEMQNVKKMIAEIFKQKEKQEGRSWGEKFVDPTNDGLGGLMAGIVIALTILVAGVFFLTGMGKIANSVKELKPASTTSQSVQQKKSEEARLDEIAAEYKLSEKGTESSAENIKVRFGVDLSAQALTQEMKSIRDSFISIVGQDRFTVAELVSDLYYHKQGLSDLRHLVSFVGFSAFAPVFELFAKSQMEKLEAYLEDQRNEPPNILQGVETAQRLLTNYNSRSAQLQSINPLLNETIRKNLLAADDKLISSWIKESSPTAEFLAILLRISTADRAQVLMGAMDTAQLRESFVNIENEPAKLAGSVGSLTTSLEKMVATKEVQEGGKKLRLIKSLLTKTYADDEDKMLSLLKDESVEVRYEIMKTRYLFGDLIYLPNTILRTLLDSFSTSERSDFIYLCPLQIREHILKSYPQDSGVLAGIKEELESIEKNSKRSGALEAQKRKTLEDFMQKLRNRIAGNETLLKSSILAFSEQEGVNMPAGLLDQIGAAA